MPIRMPIVVVLTSAFLALSGCVMTPVQRDAAAARTQYGAVSSRALDDMAQRSPGYLRESPTIYIGSGAIPLADRHLPKVFDTAVELRRQVPMNLSTVAQFISSKLHVPVRITPDAVKSAEAMGVDPIVSMTGAQAPAGSFILNYHGTLKGLLNQVASRTGNGWHYDASGKGVIVLSHVQTRTFYVASLPVNSSVQSSISNASKNAQQQLGGSDSGSGSGSGGEQGQQITGTQDTTSEASISPLKDAEAAVKTMLSDKGKLSVDTSTPSVTVTDVPAVLRQVSSYVAALNQHLTRQVVLDVKIYSLTTDRGDQYGINWGLVYQTLSGRYGLTLHSAGDLGDDANALSVSVIDPSYNYNGSQAMVQALSTQGNLVAKKSVGLVTLSGRPAPLQVTSQQGYLKSSGTDLVANVGSSSRSEPGSITTGFGMNFLPIVMDDHRILMQIAINISTPRGFRTIISGNSRIEAPNVDTQQLLQQVLLPSGATLVMSGYESDSFKGDNQGIGSPNFWLAGGSVNDSHKRSTLVILVTPRVL